MPLFIFEQRYALGGSPPSERFQRLIAKLRAEDGRAWAMGSPPFDSL